MRSQRVHLPLIAPPMSFRDSQEKEIELTDATIANHDSITQARQSTPRVLEEVLRFRQTLLESERLASVYSA